MAELIVRAAYEHIRQAQPDLPYLAAPCDCSDCLTNIGSQLWELDVRLASILPRPRVDQVISAIRGQLTLKGAVMSTPATQQVKDATKERRLRLSIQAAARQALYELKRIGQTLSPDQHADLVDLLANALEESKQ
jgi:hypothetical protein